MIRNKENQPMSEWLKDDAVTLDLPAEEIIQALCEEIEQLKDSLIEWQKGLFACMTAFVSIKRLSGEENIRSVADLAIKVIEGLPKLTEE